MSRADTVRSELDLAYARFVDANHKAFAALDAFVAENQRLRDALDDEIVMEDQSVRTLREMRDNWRELVEEFEGGYLLESYLDSLIEDLDTKDARAALDEAHD